MVVHGEVKGFISWNGWYYGYRQLKHGNKYTDQRMLGLMILVVELKSVLRNNILKQQKNMLKYLDEWIISLGEIGGKYGRESRI